MLIGQGMASRYVFLDYLRALAAWLVVWDHLANIVPAIQGRSFAPAQFAQDNFAVPLGMIQDFGWFGVALFFLISGFIISDRASVESARQFLVRRVLRIYPMLVVAVLLSTLLVATRDQITIRNVLLNMTLANYLVLPQIVLVGAAWTLVVEMMFYALTAATQAARTSPHRIGANLLFIALVIWKARAFGSQFFLVAAAACYLPVLVMGQTVYWWLVRRRLSALWGLAYLLGAYGVFLYGLRSILPAFLPVANSYLVSVTYALLLFITLLHVKVPERRVVRFLSDTSYSMYLLHGIIGWSLLLALMPRMSLWLAIPLSMAASLAAAYMTYRLVELPGQRLARRLTRKKQDPDLPTTAAP